MGAIVFLLTVPVIALALVRFLDGATACSSRRARFMGWLGQSKLWHVVVAIALSACIYASLVSDHDHWVLPTFVALVLVFCLLVRSWHHEFLFLMALRDEDLPGANDKLIWAFLLLAVPPLGLWLFRSYREARWPEPARAKGEAMPGVL